MMDKKLLGSGDLWSGFVLAVLGVYIITEARNWTYMGNDGPGAGFFPLWYGIVMVVLSAVLVVSSLRRKRSADGHVDWRAVARVGATWFTLAIAVALLKVLGFVLSFAFLAFTIIRFLYLQSALRALVIAAAYAAGFWLLFDLALGIELPAGWLGF
jgi:putative tricarboxylic transport membrane protein